MISQKARCNSGATPHSWKHIARLRSSNKTIVSKISPRIRYELNISSSRRIEQGKEIGKLVKEVRLVAYENQIEIGQLHCDVIDFHGLAESLLTDSFSSPGEYTDLFEVMYQGPYCKRRNHHDFNQAFRKVLQKSLGDMRYTELSREMRVGHLAYEMDYYVAYLHKLELSRASRARGIGTEMLKELLSLGSGFDFVILRTDEVTCHEIATDQNDLITHPTGILSPEDSAKNIRLYKKIEQYFASNGFTPWEVNGISWMIY